MRAADDVLRDLGMEVLEVGAGRAQLAMSLADSAFAFACNSHGRHALAQRCMRLIADATERHRAGRGGLYDVTVWDDATGDRRVSRTRPDGAGELGRDASTRVTCFTKLVRPSAV